MTLECVRLLELHSYLSAASGMLHHEQNQAAVRCTSQLFIKQMQIKMWHLLYLTGIHEKMPDDVIQSNMPEQHWRHVNS